MTQLRASLFSKRLLMKSTDILSTIEELLELSPGTLKGPEKLSDCEGWDSLAVLSMIAMTDDKFDIILGGNAVVQAKTVNDLVNLVLKKAKAKAA